MQKQTLEQLKEKVWYRLLKVLYFGIFLAVVLFGFSDNYYRYNDKELDYEKSRVICKNGSSMLLSQEVKHFPIGDLYAIINGSIEADKYFDKDLDLILRSHCSISIIEMKDGSKIGVAYNKLSTINTDNIVKIDGELFTKPTPSFRLLDKPIDAINNYKINFIFKNHLLTFILNEFILLIICVIAFELGRRLFYYIVLGSFRPRL